MLTIQYMTLRLTAKPTAPDSITYQVGQTWYNDPTEYITVPDHKRAEKYLIDCIKSELDAALSDDAGNLMLEADWGAMKKVKSLSQLGKIPGVSILGEL